MNSPSPFASVAMCGWLMLGAFVRGNAAPPSAPAKPDAQATAARKLKQAQQIVYEQTRALDDRSLASAFAPRWAIFRASQAVRLAPRYAPCRRLLGRALMEAARFAEAAASYRKSLQLEPHNSQGETGLRDAERLRDLLRSLPLSLETGRRVFRLAEIPARPKPSVFVVIGSFNGDDFELVEARYFVWRNGRYRETFRAPRVGRSDGPEEVRSCRTWVGDFQKVGRQQVMLVTASLGADWNPTFVDAFEVKGTSLTTVLRIDSDHPPELTDLDHDGRPEIKVDHLIGVTVPHVGMDFWYDVYRYNGKQYVRANQRFPALTRRQIESLRQDLQGAPDDVDFLEHVALAYRDLGQAKTATLYEKRARQAAAKSRLHRH
jgi:tetratricopeptide (TPR) repeat protein